MAQAFFTTAGATTWTVPSGVTFASFECWGGGGGGADVGFGAGDGGGGGAYSSIGIGVTASVIYAITVAEQAEPGADGNGSVITLQFDDTAICYAEGGYAGGIGGRAFVGVGATTESGGDGGQASGNAGGGGGGAAGEGGGGGFGGNAAGFTPGAGGAGAGIYSGNGSQGADVSTGADPGFDYGGGGGGFADIFSAGKGAQGLVVITYFEGANGTTVYFRSPTGGVAYGGFSY